MLETVKLATARELAAAGSVRDTVLVGQRGGYAVLLKVGMAERTLATKEGTPRIFGALDAAARVLREELGIARYHVDATGFTARDVQRRRPDRAAALKRTHEDAAYLAFLEERAEAGRRDPVRYTSEEAEVQMAAFVRDLRAGREAQ